MNRSIFQKIFKICTLNIDVHDVSGYLDGCFSVFSVDRIVRSWATLRVLLLNEVVYVD